jgi:hypothetical protein
MFALSPDVLDEMERVRNTVIYWRTKWIEEEQKTLAPPPVWKWEWIHFTDPELMLQPSSNRLFTPPPDNSVKTQRLPNPVGFLYEYDSYESYHKVERNSCILLLL